MDATTAASSPPVTHRERAIGHDPGVHHPTTNDARLYAARLWDAILPPYLRYPKNSVDLSKVARRLAVTDVLYHFGLESGRTDWGTGAPTIHLAYNRSEPRRRFTLAHELAHVVCRRPPLPIDTANHDRFGQVLHHFDEEWVCDILAAELLVPSTVVLRITARPNSTLSLRDATGYAQRLKVSLAVLANRVASLGNRWTLLQIRRGRDQKWRVESRAGSTPRGWDGILRIANFDEQQLRVCGHLDEPLTTQGHIDVEISAPSGRNTQRLRCEMLARGNVVNLLVAPPEAWRAAPTDGSGDAKRNQPERQLGLHDLPWSDLPRRSG